MSSVLFKRLSTAVAFLALGASFQLIVAPNSQAAEVKLTIVAMGDSYTSGNGALDYFGAINCYKSHNNYARKFSDMIGGGIKVEYHNLACNGAKAADIVNQIQLLTPRQRAAVDVVLLTVGGNDMGFSGVVLQCFAPVFRDAKGCRAKLDESKAKMSTAIDSTYHRLRELAVMMPEAKIVLVGYPDLVDSSSDSCNFTMASGAVIVDPVNDSVWLSRHFEDRQRAVVDKLNIEFGGRFQFVSLKTLFKGHENCGKDTPWLRDFFDTLIIEEWWHPNVEGHLATAKYLYQLAVHKGQEDVFRYGNLPLTCGFTVARASTYGTIGGSKKTWSHDQAIDLPAPSGTKVVAAASGTAYVNYSSGFGYYVDIVDSLGVTHRTAHLQSSGLIGDGSTVYQGQTIGLVGTTGNSTGPHVHYEQRRGVAQISIVWDGPKLEWGEDIGPNQDRYTTHSLESGNCPGNIPGGIEVPKGLSTEELAFYRASDGTRIFHDVRSDSGQIELARAKWKTGWDIIVAMEINGDSSSEVLFYDSHYSSTRGRAEIYKVTSTGLSGPLRQLNWSKGWTHIVPIDLDGDRKDELIVYSSTTGRYYIIDVRADGSTIELNSGYWSKGWQSIVPININNSRGQEVLFYKEGSSRATALIYATSDKGLAAQLRKISWSNGWRIIVPIDMDGDGRDELILYNPSSGRHYFIDIASNGSPIELSSGTWSKGWDIIAPIEVDGDRYSEVLFYKSNHTHERGLGVFYNVTAKGLGERLKSFAWSKGWTYIFTLQLPGR